MHATAARPTDTAGLISLALGLVSLLMIPCGCVGACLGGLYLYPVAMVFSLIGLVVGFYGRESLRVAGIVINTLALVPSLIFTVLLVLALTGYVATGSGELVVTVEEDPAAVEQVARSMAQLDMPAEYLPKQAVTMKKIGLEFGTLALYDHASDEHAYLLLKKINPTVVDEAAEHMPELPELDVQESDFEEITVKNEPTFFTFSRGTIAGGQQEYWLVEGEISGEFITTTLSILAPAEMYDREQLREVVESIR